MAHLEGDVLSLRILALSPRFMVCKHLETRRNGTAIRCHADGVQLLLGRRTGRTQLPLRLSRAGHRLLALDCVLLLLALWHEMGKAHGLLYGREALQPCVDGGAFGGLCDYAGQAGQLLVADLSVHHYILSAIRPVHYGIPDVVHTFVRYFHDRGRRVWSSACDIPVWVEPISCVCHRPQDRLAPWLYFCHAGDSLLSTIQTNQYQDTLRDYRPRFLRQPLGQCGGDDLA